MTTLTTTPLFSDIHHHHHHHRNNNNNNNNVDCLAAALRAAPSGSKVVEGERIIIIIIIIIEVGGVRTRRCIPTLLNNIPHARDIRRFFYDDATESVVRAMKDGEKKTRVKVFSEFPELNVEGDVFRAGTLLEMVRTMATALARMERRGGGGKQRVKLCVQGSMGTGVFQGLPLSLSGISRLIDLMDWEEDVVERISNGAIGKDHAKDDEDVFILICPQNIVGYSILPYMEEMMEVAGDRPMILFNPKLGDIQSAGNVMSIRGRQGRMDFANSWEEIYHFRLLYRKPYFFPIYGALRKSYSASPDAEKWELYKRFGKMDDEYYQLMEVYEKQPNPDQMTKVIWGKP